MRELFFIGLFSLSLMSYSEDSMSPGKEINLYERNKWLANIKSVVTNKSPIKAEIRTHGGVPTIFVNDIPLPPMFYASFNEITKPFYEDIPFRKSLANAGIHLYLPQFYLPEDTVTGKRNGAVSWQDQIEFQLKKILEVDPDAYIIPRIWFVPNEEFSDNYPDEITRFEDNNSIPYMPGLSAYGHVLNHNISRYSFASLVWERKSAEQLLLFIDYICKSRYANRVIGYFLTAGACGEWVWWHDIDKSKHRYDYSPCMQKYFRAFLLEKYNGDMKKLRMAWGDPSVDFENAAIPTIEEWKPWSDVYLWDQIKNTEKPGQLQDDANFFNGNFPPHLKMIDYYQALGDVIEERKIYLAQVVKKATSGNALVGAFHGSLSGIGCFSAGNSSYKKCLNSPDIDFFVAPPPYEGRNLGDHLMIRFLPGSAKVNNKIWISESDIRSHLTDKFNKQHFGGTDNITESISALEREFSHILSNGVYGYWYDTYPLYKDGKIIESLAKMQEIGRLSMKVDRGSNAEIAVFIGQQSLYSVSPVLSYWLLDQERTYELSRLGSMPDYFDIDDIPKINLSQYKLFVFLHCFALNNQQRANIEKYLKKDNKVLLWIYAPGVINYDKKPFFSIDYLRELIDINCNMSEKKYRVDMQPTSSEMLGLPTENLIRPERTVTSGVWGAKDAPWIQNTLCVAPTFFINDKTCVSLARFFDGGKDCLGVKVFPNYTSIYSAVPYLPASLLKRIAQYAKIHIYSDSDDIVYHNKSFLSVHAVRSGKKTIRLPHEVNVYDLYEDKKIGEHVKEFTFSMPQHETRLFLIDQNDIK